MKFLVSKGHSEREVTEKIKNNQELKVDEESECRAGAGEAGGGGGDDLCRGRAVGSEPGTRWGTAWRWALGKLGGQSQPSESASHRGEGLSLPALAAASSPPPGFVSNRVGLWDT